ncbi:hypothetical protein BYT27DRAFT_7244374 [Phlegmacium glaucopus]|nr:hypothetical protein BYT27DRAFT_7244374 [Phlegmacium glaucopus]
MSITGDKPGWREDLIQSTSGSKATSHRLIRIPALAMTATSVTATCKTLANRLQEYSGGVVAPHVTDMCAERGHRHETQDLVLPKEVVYTNKGARVEIREEIIYLGKIKNPLYDARHICFENETGCGMPEVEYIEIPVSVILLSTSIIGNHVSYSYPFL